MVVWWRVWTTAFPIYMSQLVSRITIWKNINIHTHIYTYTYTHVASVSNSEWNPFLINFPVMQSINFPVIHSHWIYSPTSHLFHASFNGPRVLQGRPGQWHFVPTLDMVHASFLYVPASSSETARTQWAKPNAHTLTYPLMYLFIHSIFIHCL